MWIAENWKDYELIDCGGGERLEKWGNYILVRPDPQAIWKRSSENRYWRSPDAQYKRSSSGGGEWTKKQVLERWQIRYRDYVFNIKPMNFKHTGIFPEQASNWDFIDAQIRGAKREVSVLNLFAYTGGATVAAAAAGAHVCHVDASKGMVSWAKENLKISGLEDRPVRFIVDDCIKYIQREIRRGRKYDAIIMDPPSYGRGPMGEIWQIENEIFDFVSLCAELLSDKPLFLLISSYTAGLSAPVMGYVLDMIFKPKYKKSAQCSELMLPCTASGLNLPCGSAARYVF